MELIELLFLLRYNVLLVGVFLFVVWGSRPKGPLAAMLGGMYELSPKRGGVVAMVATMFVAFLAMITQTLLRYAPARFGVVEGPWWLVFVILVPALVGLFLLVSRLVQCALVRSATLLTVTVGIAVGCVLALGGAWLQQFFAVPGLFVWLLQNSPEGYFDSEGKPATEHVALIYVVVLYVTVYAFLGYWTGRRIRGDGKLPVPALGWVVQLFLLLALSLNGASFYLDKFHVALVPVFVFLISVWGWLGRGWIEPHTYRAFSVPEERRGLPRPAVRLALEKTKGRAVIVCASGGGIHAAAWAGAILGRLHERCPKFLERLALTSSVSGGSVGCMYYLAGVQVNPLLTMREVFAVASESSLDHVAWGFGFRDLVRYLMPVGRFFRWGNRAWALEKAWARFGETFPVRARLSEWELAVRSGQLPGSVFNTTLVETGERFAVSTVDLIERRDDPECRSEFAHLYPGLEIPLSTAAGLSAAFPIVSPASRIWVRKEDGQMPEMKKRYHVTDGGFYDNYGVVSAVEFLQLGKRQLAQAGKELPEILLVRIMGHPDPKDTPKAENGLLFQIKAPLRALLGMRSSSQAVRNNVELELLAAALGPGKLRVVDLAYPEEGAPLTWHLTVAQKREILDALAQPTIENSLREIAAFCD
jgi:hypothetical protein